MSALTSAGEILLLTKSIVCNIVFNAEYNIYVIDIHTYIHTYVTSGGIYITRNEYVFKQSLEKIIQMISGFFANNSIQFHSKRRISFNSIQFNSQQFNFTTSFVFIELWFVQTSSQSLSSTAPSNTKKFIMTSCWRGWWLLIAPVMVELHVFWIIYGPGKMGDDNHQGVAEIVKEAR